jgi:hypothetical protein
MKLTLSMATYDDYDGVYFTVQSLRLHHRLPEGTEIVILDNNPTSAHGLALAHFSKTAPGIRIVEVTRRKSSFVKYDIATVAAGDVILGLDCHVLLQPGFIEALLAYWAAHPDSCDMLTGPLLYNDLKATSVKMEPRWRGHDFGCWADDHAAMVAGLPFPVEMQGMGCFSFLKTHFPKINPAFSGFGAEEWYVAEKVRQHGGRVVCHPQLGWNHRFDWPHRTFPLRLTDKVRNYYLGWLELYGRLDHPMIVEMTNHWRTQMPAAELDKVIRGVLLELRRTHGLEIAHT